MFEWAVEQREYAMAQLESAEGERRVIYERMIVRMDRLIGLIAASDDPRSLRRPVPIPETFPATPQPAPRPFAA